MSKFIHHFHHETGEFFCSTLARMSPEETGVYLVPAHATDIAPPPPSEGLATIWDGDKWKQITDPRGEWYDENGTLVNVVDLRSDTSALSKLPRTTPDHVLNAGVWVLDAALKSERLAREVRLERNARLDEADKKINTLEDAGVSSGTWRQYRVWLRDVPLQPGFPLTVDWGTRPI